MELAEKKIVDHDDADESESENSEDEYVVEKVQPKASIHPVYPSFLGH